MIRVGAGRRSGALGLDDPPTRVRRRRRHVRFDGGSCELWGMSEPRVVVAHREHLWWLLAEARSSST